jgi:fructosamine-3-kinase
VTLLPAAIRESVEAVTRFGGTGRRIEHVEPISGGCVSNGTLLTFGSGDRLFLKWKAAAPVAMFAAEAEGLGALRAAADAGGAEVLIPEPLAHGHDGANGWLLLECMEPGKGGIAADEVLGRALAAIHGARTDAGTDDTANGTTAAWGWHSDNWIGSLVQSNRPHLRWCDFWADERVGPQLTRARARGHCRQDIFDQLIDAIPNAVGDGGTREPKAALLHGDLWSGNSYPSVGGTPVLIDPAVYRGDPEVDLAMTELFGGFGPHFYAAYDEVRRISTEYRSHRRDLYQLYYLLVHVNLFGPSYEAGARACAERVVRALG